MEPLHDLEFDIEDQTFDSENQLYHPDDKQFDNIVQKLQENIINPEFQQIQKTFILKYSTQFSNSEQNKSEHFLIFQDYQHNIQKFLMKELQTLPNFSMQRFQQLLNTRKNQIDQTILDLIITSLEFQQFKSMMLDVKKSETQLTCTGTPSIST